MRLRLLIAAILTCAASYASAADLPPASKPIAAVIDQFIDARIADADARAATQATDATLVRRLTLDLVGRIPTAGEADAYVKSSDPQKRAKLIDRLMASPGFVRHQAALFETMLDPDGKNRGGLRDYLTSAMAEKKSWDRIFRELMLPDQSDPKMKGAAEFLRERVRDTDRLTNDVSVAFFGVNVSCAQCHNHPLVQDWKQDHFYGMKAFLARTFDNGGFLAEHGYGAVKFKPTKGPERTAKMMFLTGAIVESEGAKEPDSAEMKKEKDALEKAKAAKKAPPAPKFSARAKLVSIALESENAHFFARSIVNRMWHRFFGAGLVSPLDQMHSENLPTHPELLAWLARDTEQHGYDLRRLIHGLVMSKAYSRSSQYDSESRPSSKLFAVARLKPLTPLQLATSLKIAATDPAVFVKLKPEEFEKRIEQLERSARGFASNIAQPTDNFQIGVGEALLFSNGDRVRKEFLSEGGGTTLDRAKAMKEPKDAVMLLMKAAYGRDPTTEEAKMLVAFVEKRKGHEATAYRHVLWALVTGPEFRFSY